MHLGLSMRIKQIQKRLATIGMYLPERRKKPEAVAERVLPKKRDQLLSETSHSIVMKNDRYYCAVCKNSFRIKDPSMKHWLALQCKAPSESLDTHKPVKLNASIHIGNRVTHSSHYLCSFRGVVYCNTCGARAGSNQIRHLGTQCEPPTAGGLIVLRAIANGQMPPGVTEWPE